MNYILPWPEELFRLVEAGETAGLSMAERIGLTSFSFSETAPEGKQLQAGIALLDEVALELPGLEGFAIIFGAHDASASTIGAEFTLRAALDDPLAISILNVDMLVRLRQDLLRPVSRDSQGSWAVAVDTNGIPRPFEIHLDDVSVSADVEGNLGVAFASGAPGIAIDAFMIGETGIVVVADQPVQLYLSGDLPPPLNRPAGWRGIYIPHAAIHLPSLDFPAVPAGLEFTDCSIGSAGFSGQVDVNWAIGTVQGSLFGLACELTHLDATFDQNILTAFALRGRISLPFFDAPIDVEIGIALDGGFTVGLANTTGILTTPVLRMELDSIGFALDDGIFTATLSGQLTPEFGGLEWPSFKVEQLAIDSHGNVKLEGGWLDLRDHYSLDFYGFQLEITRLGFGKTEDGGKWIGCSGALKLVEGLPAGASVEGLRVIWYDDDPGQARITLEGVGVEFEIPKVLRFKGAVAYRELSAANHRFDGAIKLELLALKLEIDANLVVGSESGATYFAIHLGLELPAGIPLATTGLGIYGMAGLFAHEMAPDRHPDEEWYEGWYKRGPEVGVTDLAHKWTNRDGSMALGAGITLGTMADNGFAFSGKMLLLLVFPGPIMLIEGQANLLTERSADPTFRALAVLDMDARTFLIGLDAQYMYGDSGQLIDIHGGAEAFFDFEHIDGWHIYLGQDNPREKRIRAELIRFFGANAYLMLKPTSLTMGAWVGYDKTWRFGPLRVTIESWIEGNASISIKPVHLHGDLWLHGKVELSVFGFGLGLSMDARLAADVFDPFHLLAQLSVGINLPWLLPDFDVDITIEWGPERFRPPLPLPLQEVAIEHLKVTTSWPLPRGTLLLPNYDSNGDGMIELPSPSVDAQRNAPPPQNAPIVPLDCRPHLTFARPLWDDAMVGVNLRPLEPEYEQIGDPALNQGPIQVRYGLTEVALEQHVGGEWQLVAAAPDPDPSDPQHRKKLYGSWAPVPTLPDPSGEAVAQVKLWLWSRNSFDYIRYNQDPDDLLVLIGNGEYPCPPAAPADREICCDFEQIDPSRAFPSPWQCPQASIQLSWSAPTLQQVSLRAQLEGRTHALCFPRTITGTTTPNEVTIQLTQPAKSVRLIVSSLSGVQATGYSAQGAVYGPVVGGAPGSAPWVEISGQQHLVRVVVRGYSDFCIFGVCTVVGMLGWQIVERQAAIRHMSDELARWSQADIVLEPHTSYRLKVVTTLQTQGEWALSQPLTQTEFAYFRTEGPPGLATLALPSGHPNPNEFASGLEDLRPYVRQTIPASVPPAGEPPLLTRPVYRAYDVGVEFNENYVDLMYQLDGRDLGLYLYDNSNQPARDVLGRLIVLSNRWGRAESVKLSMTEERWIRAIGRGGCLVFDEQDILTDSTLSSSGLLLAPDTLYEARLVPLLLHESWKDSAGTSANGPAGALGRWMIADQGSTNGPSRWEVHSETIPPPPTAPPGTGSATNFFIIQTSAIWGGTRDGADPVKPGTLLLWADNLALATNHLDQPGNWSDYRLSAYLRAFNGDAMGLVFRHHGTNDYYRFSMDANATYRRLVKVAGGGHTILAEDNFSHELGRDYLISIEAIGSSLRVYQDGALIFDDADSTHTAGRIGLYCWSNAETRFGDVRVEDFRPTAPVVYRFPFTTSRFANFFHQLHSYQDETWRLALGAAPSDSAIAELVGKGVVPATGLDDTETRAYDALAEQILGPAAWQCPSEVQVTKIERGTSALALLVQSPEPIDWQRTSLAIMRATDFTIHWHPPGAVKLTDITIGTQQPNQESVTLLLRESLDLSGYRIEYDLTNRLGAEPSNWQPYYTFGAEQRLGAGTRIHLFAGNRADPAPATPGARRRFIASGNTSGQLTFPSGGVNLRLVDRSGRADHMRGFRPASAYTAITGTARILRSADGTSFFILIPSAAPAGSTIAAGQYRLKLAYERNNRLTDPSSPILKEAGSSATEVVVIDIP
jgi:hypothetical protein